MSYKRAFIAIAAFKAVMLVNRWRQTKHQHPQISLSEGVQERIFPHLMVNKQGMLLHTRQWTAARHWKGLVFLCHGMGEHAGRYEALGRHLNAQQYLVFAMDHQGHGQSQGCQAFVEKFQDYVNDYIEFVAKTQAEFMAEYPELKEPPACFLVGHSMGGLISTLIAKQSAAALDQEATGVYGDASKLWPWKGVVLSAPALAPKPEDAKPAVIFAGRILEKLFPKLTLTPISTVVSGINTVNQYYKDDRLMYQGNIRTRLALEMLDTMAELKTSVAEVKFPYLLLQGDADQLVEKSGATYFYENTASEDKQYQVITGGAHELLFDVKSAEVTTAITDWINERVFT
jgi:alpha-beta hydrolase superfamily lysophospholipase